VFPPARLFGVVPAVGVAVVAGGSSVLADQRAGTPGEARVSECPGGPKPSLGTPLVLWGLGAPVVLLAVVGLVGWWRDG
jgi:hypothetical protein